MSEVLKNNDPAVPSSAPVSPAGEVPEAEGSPSLESESPAAGWNDRWLVPGVCLFLAAMVWAVFGRTLGYEFVNYDDNLYVYDNPVVQKGLTWEGFRWALTYGGTGHRHPLTWLSHMLDCQWYGLNAGGHHLTNILLHTASVILLFLVLRRMTGFLWRCALVAAVFAIHPLRVESVAWVAGRKDVLSGVFFMLTLWAYARYVQKQSRVEGRESSASIPALNLQPSTLNFRSSTLDPRRWTFYYWLALIFFALGLMSKPMLVTLPFVLLLLDYWPLGRLSSFTPRVWFRLAAEKTPLFALMIGSCVATVLVPEKVSAGQMSFGLRLENAVVSYVTYLWQMIHPSGLACVYPNPTNGLPAWQVAGALGLLLAISGAVFALRKTRPYLVVGWLWYVGMMIPVIGLVQISYYAAHADRYTYLPQIGLYLVLAWAAADLCAGWRHRRLVLGGLSTILLVALIFFARTQTSYWRNSELLWTHTLACTSDNAEARYNLGTTLLQKGRVDEAIGHYQTALQIKPDYVEACNNLGNALLQKGRVDEAIAQYQQALQIKPGFVEACNNLGNALLQKGRVDEAIIQYQAALKIKPASAEACYNLGNVLFQKGSVDEAIAEYQKALRIKPDYVEACNNFGLALLQKGKVDEAIAQYQKALHIRPDYAGARNNLDNALFLRGKVDETIVQYQRALQINPGSADALNKLAWLLATCPDARIRDGAQAVQYAGRACELTHDGVTIVVGTLAAAYAEAGRYDDAIAAAQKACALATAAGEQDLLEKNKQLLALYLKHQPYHETAEKFVSAAP